MTAPTFNVTIEQGATFTKSIAIEGLDLTDASARLQARPSYTGDAVVSLTSEVGGGIVITVTDVENSILDITITATNTAGLKRHLRYDLEVELANGTVYRLLQGKMMLNKEITK